MKLALKYLLTISLLLSLHLMSHAQNDTLKVFILAGQSNMAGYGQIEGPEIMGTLEYMVTNDTEGEFSLLTDDNEEFVVREDVWVRYNHEFGELDTGPLGVGFGAYSEFIGPEYGFGFQLGEHLEEPILLIKTAWGGKSLAVDFRPPSSGGTTGAYYLKMLEEINTCLENLVTEFPEYDGTPYKIAGFGWHQGWNDGETLECMLEIGKLLIYLS